MNVFTFPGTPSVNGIFQKHMFKTIEHKLRQLIAHNERSNLTQLFNLNHINY